MKLLLEAGPLLGFLLVYATAGIYAATAAMVLLSALAVLIGRWRSGHSSRLSLFTLLVSALLGGLTLTLRDPRFIQYKPTIVLGAFALALGATQWTGPRVALQTMFGAVLALPEPLWRRLNLAWALYFATHAVVNVAVARYCSLETWVYFKVFGFGALTALFAVLHLPLIWGPLRAAVQARRAATAVR